MRSSPSCHQYYRSASFLLSCKWTGNANWRICVSLIESGLGDFVCENQYCSPCCWLVNFLKIKKKTVEAIFNGGRSYCITSFDHIRLWLLEFSINIFNLAVWSLNMFCESISKQNTLIVFSYDWIGNIYFTSSSSTCANCVWFFSNLIFIWIRLYICGWRDQFTKIDLL